MTAARPAESWSSTIAIRPRSVSRWVLRWGADSWRSLRKPTSATFGASRAIRSGIIETTIDSVLIIALVATLDVFMAARTTGATSSAALVTAITTDVRQSRERRTQVWEVGAWWGSRASAS